MESLAGFGDRIPDRIPPGVEEGKHHLAALLGSFQVKQQAEPPIFAVVAVMVEEAGVPLEAEEDLLGEEAGQLWESLVCRTKDPPAERGVLLLPSDRRPAAAGAGEPTGHRKLWPGQQVMDDLNLHRLPGYNQSMTDPQAAIASLINAGHIDQALELIRAAGLTGLSLPRVRLYRAVLGAISLPQVNLHGANLRSANLDGADLRGATLKKATLDGASLRGANLRGATLVSAQASGVDFEDADLSDTRMQGVDFQGTSFRGTNLRGANLRQCKMRGVDLRRANLAGADLSGAALLDAQLQGAQSDAQTRWPSGFTPEHLQA